MWLKCLYVFYWGKNQEDVYNFSVAANKRLIAIQSVLCDDIDKKWRDDDISVRKQINDNKVYQYQNIFHYGYYSIIKVVWYI